MSDSKDIFLGLKERLLMLDPVAFIEKHLTLDGKPFKLNGTGYKPFVDIYRYAGVKALENNGKPMILVKSRQVGGTTMASALEMYFMGSGLFGNGKNPPIRVIHAFPQLDHAAAYSKTKLNPMIVDSVDSHESTSKKIVGKSKSFMQQLLDTTSDSNNSLHFKQFSGGNHVWIESTGLNADRLRGRSADVIFFDECFPYDQKIQTEAGNIPIGKLHAMFVSKDRLPRVLTLNEDSGEFEYKEIVNAWQREKRKLFELKYEGKKLLCTGNHRFLTDDGWKRVEDMVAGCWIMNSSKSYSLVQSVSKTELEDIVYDLEIKDNHNFIVLEDDCGLVAHNCQDITGTAISNSVKMLNAAKYGRIGDGVQVYFGTPKKKGSDYYKMWMASSQQYYHLGCERCKEYFPLYTPESDDWEKIWIHDFIVKCTKCGHEQDKRPAAERGKWISSKPDEDCQMVGFHINQLYMPSFTKEKIMSEKPGIHPIATERSYRNEVLGEFFQGDSSPITAEEIRELCGDLERKMRASIPMEEDLIVTLGIDYGLKSNLEEMADVNKSGSQGQSYTTAVILMAKGPQLLSIEYCRIFKRNDEEYKKELIDQVMRQYSVKLAIGDIGFSQDFSEKLHIAYGDRYLVSRAHNTVNGHIKYNKEVFPKEITFQKNFYYSELIEQLKGGRIRFPLGDYEKVAWLIQHCSNNEIKPSISRGGDPTIHYIKSGPNDGFAALLNAYIGYKFIITNGLSTNNPILMRNGTKPPPMVVGGYVNRRF